MNTRGIVQLVVLNIGVQLKVISEIIFALFVLMATILTFLTSPILYLLYRKNFNIKKLSAPQVADELRHIREGDIGMDDYSNMNQTEPVTDLEGNELKRNSSTLTNQLSTSNGALNTLFTVDEQLNYPQINQDPARDQLAVLDNIVAMPVCPRRPIYMTKF